MVVVAADLEAAAAAALEEAAEGCCQLPAPPSVCDPSTPSSAGMS